MQFESYPRIARHAALREPAALASALRSTDAPFAEIGATLRYHHLVGLVLSTIDEEHMRSQLDAELIRAIEVQRPVQPITADELLHGFDEVRLALSEKNIPVMLLKGLYFAQRFYGGHQRRPQFDLDILVPARERGAAARVLKRQGFTRQAYDLHSQTFTRERLKVDVHGWLRWAPAYRMVEHIYWQSARPVRIGDREILTLTDEFNLVLLGLACFEDLGQGMVRLKQLLDVLLFVRQVDASLNWDAFFGRRESEGIDGVLANVFALVLVVLEGEQDAPRLRAALDDRRRLLTGTTRTIAMDLIFSPRKRPASLAWFGRIYPGSLAYYLVWFWLGGFPLNLRQIQPARIGTMLRVVLDASASQSLHKPR